MSTQIKCDDCSSLFIATFITILGKDLQTFTTTVWSGGAFREFQAHYQRDRFREERKPKRETGICLFIFADMWRWLTGRSFFRQRQWLHRACKWDDFFVPEYDWSFWMDKLENDVSMEAWPVEVVSAQTISERWANISWCLHSTVSGRSIHKSIQEENPRTLHQRTQVFKRRPGVWVSGLYCLQLWVDCRISYWTSGQLYGQYVSGINQRYSGQWWRSWAFDSVAVFVAVFWAAAIWSPAMCFPEGEIFFQTHFLLSSSTGILALVVLFMINNINCTLKTNGVVCLGKQIYYRFYYINVLLNIWK